MLFGEQRERGVLGRLLVGARDGRGGAIVVLGEPGIGKTALIEQVVTSAQNFRFLRTAGQEGEMELAYAALLSERDGDIGVGGGLAGRLRRPAFQLDDPLGSGVQLGRRQPGQVVSERGVPAARSAELVTSSRVDLPVHRLVRLTLDDLARGEAEGPGSGTPPPAGRFASLGGAEVVATDRAPRSDLALGLPDVAEVVALGDGDYHGQSGCLLPPGPVAAGLTMIISMNAMVCAAMNHGEQKAVHDRLVASRAGGPRRRGIGQWPGKTKTLICIHKRAVLESNQC